MALSSSKNEKSLPGKLPNSREFHTNPENQSPQLTFNQIQPKKSLKNFGGRVTREELSKHDSIQDCWTAIDGKVYDVTSYIRFHPGGRKILLGAGKDATDIFSKCEGWWVLTVLL